MLLINFLLLSLFASSHCAPKTLLVETEAEGEADNMNPDEESETEKNENFNEGLENQYKSGEQKSALDYQQR